MWEWKLHPLARSCFPSGNWAIGPERERERERGEDGERRWDITTSLRLCLPCRDDRQDSSSVKGRDPDCLFLFPADVLPYIELVVTNTQLANQRLGSWCPWLNVDWFEASLPSWGHEYILHFSFLIMHIGRHQWETSFLLALPELPVQHCLLFST